MLNHILHMVLYSIACLKCKKKDDGKGQWLDERYLFTQRKYNMFAVSIYHIQVHLYMKRVSFYMNRVGFNGQPFGLFRLQTLYKAKYKMFFFFSFFFFGKLLYNRILGYNVIQNTRICACVIYKSFCVCSCPFLT